MSYVKCEDVRAISTDRLVLRLGRLSGDAMEKTGDLLRVVLEL